MIGWISESGEPPPETVEPIHDNARAKQVLAALQGGQWLVWTGDWPNGRKFLTALRKRLERRLPQPTRGALAERWRAQRARTATIAQVLGRLLVQIEPDGTVALRRAQQTTAAVQLAWGLSDKPRWVSLRTLLGALSAHGWAERGVDVPGLDGRLTPAFGVFSPTRHAYVGLLDHIELAGKRVLDVGCGTGVLGLIAAQRGATQVVAVDVEPRAVACACRNAEQLGLAGRFTAIQANLWPPEGRFDRVLFNAPWMPEQPRTRLDAAVFDAGGATLERWVGELSAHLTLGGEGDLIVSDLPERIGLCAPGRIADLVSGAGLTVRGTHAVNAAHRRAQRGDDPLQRARSAEQVVLWRLGVATS